MRPATGSRSIAAVATGVVAILAIAWGSATACADDDQPKSYDVRAVLEGAVDWMVENQQPTGAWGSHHSPRWYEILRDVPGSHNAFRYCTTSLGVCALLDSPYKPKKAKAALDRAIDYLIANANVKRPNGLEIYTVWIFGFGLQALGEYVLAHPDDPRVDRIREVGAELVRRAGLYQSPRGGWNYLDFGAKTAKPSWTYTTFTTATILIGFDRIQKAGVEVPEKMIRRAVRALDRARTPEGNFLYGHYLQYAPRMGINQDKGAACRNPVCLYSMELFGETVEKAEYRKTLDDLLVKHTRFQRVASRRPIPHESWYQVSGYFFLYGHGYAAYVLEDMPAEDRERFWPAMIDAVMHCHQPDGSFWDYPLYSYHKPYGTAFAIIALSRAPGASP